MNRDYLSLIVSVVGLVVAATSAIYQFPFVALVLLVLVVLAYVAYLIHVFRRAIPGNTFLRLAPALALVVSSVVIYWFWPATLTVILYEDLNGNGRREENEPLIADVEVHVTDSTDIPRTEKTTSKEGGISFRVTPGDVRMSVRQIDIEQEVRRGQNRILIGFVRATSSPETTIFLGAIPGERPVTSETSSRKIYAHIWYDDKERPIKSMEIDWGEGGKGWETIDLTKTDSLKFYVLPHEYSGSGHKAVHLRVTNSAGQISSPPAGVPETRNRHVDYIDIKP